jgi:hypothetical protein
MKKIKDRLKNIETKDCRGLSIKEKDLIERLLYRWKGIFVIFRNRGGLFAKLPGRPADEPWRRHVAGRYWLAGASVT